MTTDFKLRGNAETVWFFASPQKAAEEYMEYRTAFNDYQDSDVKFTVQDYIALKNAESKALIAKAIFDLPENWYDDKGCFENHFNFKRDANEAIIEISNSLDRIAKALGKED